MITLEDISSLNDDEIEGKKLFDIKNQVKDDVRLARKIRCIKKVSYLTRNTMARYKNQLVFDISKNVMKSLFPLN